MNKFFSDSSESSDDDINEIRRVLFYDVPSSDDDGSSKLMGTGIGDTFVGHQSIVYMVQVLYNLLVVTHQLIMNNTHCIFAVLI